MRTAFSCMLGLTLAASLAAQVKIETFNGPSLPTGWTAQSGTWSIVGGRAQQSAAQWGYLTLDGVKLTNCVVDVDVYWGAPGITFGGVAARHAGTAANDAIMVKVQQNSAASAGFESLWNYEQPGGALSLVNITPVMTATRIRLIALGNHGWLLCDSTQDGIYNLMVGPQTYTAHAGPGLVGVTGFTSGGSASVDNFALFDAVLVAASGATPKLGTTYNMELTTQATMPTPFICAASLSNGGTVHGNIGGIPLPDGRRIPLGIDPLLNLSLALGGPLGLVGVTDSQGFGKPSFAIPNIPALVGLGIYVAGFTIGGASGIDNISNDHYFVIQM